VFRAILKWLRENGGQDVSEYCLLTALVALIALGIFWHISGGMNALWGSSNTTLNNAGTAASSTAPSNAGAGARP